MSDNKEVVLTDDQKPEDYDIVRDLNHPESVYNLSPSSIQRAIKLCPDDIWGMTTGDLEAHGHGSVITAVERKLRQSFWLEYERAVRFKRPLAAHYIFQGITHRTHFFSRVLTNSFKVAYILTPPETYEAKLEEMLQLALDEERKILEMPLIKKTTFKTKDGGERIVESLDTSLAFVKHKIRESLQARRQGAVVQRTLQVNKNLNANVDMTINENKKLEEMKSEELRDLIKELNPTLQVLPQAIDVTLKKRSED